jgi:hypothetical protein
VVTAFTIESYKWLQADPSTQSLEVLNRIADKLDMLSINSSALITSTAARTSGARTFRVSSSTICINFLWFLSLTLALMSALFGILVQQWLREYKELPPNISAKTRVSLRQLRYDSLNVWGVPRIVSCLSSMLQLALFLYLAGIVVLLWTINNVVAALLSAVVGSFFTFYALTCILPVFSKNCPYRSSLAWGFSMTLKQFILPSVGSVFRRIHLLTHWRWFGRMREFFTLSSTWEDCSTWTDVDLEGKVEGPERTKRPEGEAEPLPCKDSIKWTAQVLPVAQIDFITPLWSELATSPQETFLMWLSWQAKGYKAQFSQDLRQEIIENLWHWSRSASERHRAQAWKKTFLAMLREALEHYCKEGPPRDYNASTIVDMTRLATKNPWVDLAPKDILEFGSVFRRTLSRALRDIIMMDQSKGVLTDWEHENLASEVLRCVKESLNSCRIDCKWYPKC